MKVTTAIIMTAGYGTRMLPATAAIQKVLLPVLDRPVVDYVVSDCLAAGVSNIIFVIPPGSHGLQDFYVGNPDLEANLRRSNKKQALAKLEQIHSQATYTFVEQPYDAGYGTAVPVQVAAPHLPKDEACIVCTGDDFLWRTDGGSDMADLVEAFTSTNAAGALLGIERDESLLHKYGVLQVEQRDGHEFLKGFVEKPEPGQAPSNMINPSKYVFTPELVNNAMEVKPDPKSGEFYVTDIVRDAAVKSPIVVQRAKGQYLDGGSVATWLQANLTVAAADKDLSKMLGTFPPADAAK